MKQEILDRLARLHYEDEKDIIKRFKFKLNISSNGHRNWRVYRCLRNYSELKYHKEKLMFYKRMLPMKPVLVDINQNFELMVCPCCEYEVRLFKNYCEECGQRLMWE